MSLLIVTADVVLLPELLELSDADMIEAPRTVTFANVLPDMTRKLMRFC